MFSGKYITHIRMVCAVTAFIFSWTSVAGAAPNLAEAINVPTELGRVSERFDSTAATSSSGTPEHSPFIIHIRDAHASLEAQKNIAALIEYLASTCNVSWVGLEGAIGGMDYSRLRNFPHEPTKKDLTEYFLAKSYFSGAEYQAVRSAHLINLWGAEDVDLFKENYTAFRRMEDVKDGVGALVDQIEQLYQHVKLKLFNAPLIALERKLSAFEKSNDFGARISFLVKEAEKTKFALNSFRNVARLAVIASPEGAKQSTAAEIASGASHPRNDNDADDIDFVALTNELETLSTDLLLKNARSEAEQNWIRLGIKIKRLKRLSILEANREEAVLFLSNSKEHGFDFILSEIRKEARSIGVALPKIPSRREIQTYTDMISAFYVSAEARDITLIQNFVAKLKTEGKDIGVLVSGGYHTDGITRFLKDEKISHAVIIPNLTSTLQDSPYDDKMLGQLVPLKPLSAHYFVATLQGLSQAGLTAMSFSEWLDAAVNTWAQYTAVFMPDSAKLHNALEGMFTADQIDGLIAVNKLLEERGFRKLAENITDREPIKRLASIGILIRAIEEARSDLGISTSLEDIIGAMAKAGMARDLDDLSVIASPRRGRSNLQPALRLLRRPVGLLAMTGRRRHHSLPASAGVGFGAEAAKWAHGENLSEIIDAMRAKGNRAHRLERYLRKPGAVEEVSVGEFRQAVQLYGDAFLDRVFTESEKGYARSQKDPNTHLAVRLAAKLALRRALNEPGSLRLTDIEVKRTEQGQPYFDISDRVQTLLGIASESRIFVSLSHEKEMASAAVSISVEADFRIGVDITTISRMASDLGRGPAFERRIFSSTESRNAPRRASERTLYFAKLFSVKEAVVKAFGDQDPALADPRNWEVSRLDANHFTVKPPTSIQSILPAGFQIQAITSSEGGYVAALARVTNQDLSEHIPLRDLAVAAGALKGASFDRNGIAERIASAGLVTADNVRYIWRTLKKSGSQIATLVEAFKRYHAEIRFVGYQGDGPHGTVAVTLNRDEFARLFPQHAEHSGENLSDDTKSVILLYPHFTDARPEEKLLAAESALLAELFNEWVHVFNIEKDAEVKEAAQNKGQSDSFYEEAAGTLNELAIFISIGPSLRKSVFDYLQNLLSGNDNWLLDTELLILAEEFATSPELWESEIFTDKGIERVIGFVKEHYADYRKIRVPKDAIAQVRSRLAESLVPLLSLSDPELVDYAARQIFGVGRARAEEVRTLWTRVPDLRLDSAEVHSVNVIVTPETYAHLEKIYEPKKSPQFVDGEEGFQEFDVDLGEGAVLTIRTFVQPGGHEPPKGRVYDRLKEKGEGIDGVTFALDNADRATHSLDRAATLGYLKYRPIHKVTKTGKNDVQINSVDVVLRNNEIVHVDFFEVLPKVGLKVGSFKPKTFEFEHSLAAIRSVGRVIVPRDIPETSDDYRYENEPYFNLNQLRAVYPDIDRFLRLAESLDIAVRFVGVDPAKLEKEDGDDEAEKDSLAALEASVGAELDMVAGVMSRRVYDSLKPDENLPVHYRGVLIINQEAVPPLEEISEGLIMILASELVKSAAHALDPEYYSSAEAPYVEFIQHAVGTMLQAEVLMRASDHGRSLVRDDLTLLKHDPGTAEDPDLVGFYQGIVRLAETIERERSAYDPLSGFTDIGIFEAISVVREGFPDLSGLEIPSDMVERVRGAYQALTKQLERIDAKGFGAALSKITYPVVAKAPARATLRRSQYVLPDFEQQTLIAAIEADADEYVFDLSSVANNKKAAARERLRGFIQENQANRRRIQKVAELEKEVNTEAEVAELNKKKTKIFFGQKALALRLNDHFLERERDFELVSALGGEIGSVIIQAESADDVRAVETRLISIEKKQKITLGQIGIQVLIDSKAGVKNVDDIAKVSSRIGSLIAGPNIARRDDMRQDVLDAAFDAEIQVIDARADALLPASYREGFNGLQIQKSSASSSVSADANAAYTPGESSVRRALEKLEAELGTAREIRILKQAERAGVLSDDNASRFWKVRWKRLYDPGIPLAIDQTQIQPTVTDLLAKGRTEHPNAKLRFIMKYDEVKDEKTGRVEFVRRGVDISEGKLQEYIYRAANALRRIGVKQGDTLSIIMPNTPQFVILNEVAQTLGAVTANLDVPVPANQLAERFEYRKTKWVLVLDSAAAKITEVIDKHRYDGIQGVIVSAVDDFFPERAEASREEPAQVSNVPTYSFMKLLDSGEPTKPAPPEWPILLSDAAANQFTGGTTGGAAKAAEHTHGSLQNLLLNRAHLTDPGLTGGEVIGTALVLSHTYGWATGMNGTIAGSNIVMIPNIDAESYLKTVFRAMIDEDIGITRFFSVPVGLEALYLLVKDLPDPRQALRRLKAVYSAGDKLSYQTWKKWRRLLGRNVIFEGFGLSEGPSSHQNHIRTNSVGSFGPPVPGAETRVIDLEYLYATAKKNSDARGLKKPDLTLGEARRLGPYQVGLIQIRGPHVAKGYADRPEQSRETFGSDGWLTTGDVGFFDDNGLPVFTGRAKDVIMVRGFTVSPNDVANGLKNIKGVKDAWAVGADDPLYGGEMVKAIIVPEPGAKLSKRKIIREAARYLQPIEIPKVVLITKRVTGLKRNFFGKIIGVAAKAIPDEATVEEDFDIKKTAALFPPAGYHYPGMGKDIHDRFDYVRHIYERASDIATELFKDERLREFSDLVGQSIDFMEISWGSQTHLLSEVDRDKDIPVWSGDYFVSALAMVVHQIALYEVFKRQYGTPKYLVPESDGEPAAFYASGLFGEGDEALRKAIQLALESSLALRRAGKIMGERRMGIVTGLADKQMDAVLGKIGGGISITDSEKMFIVNFKLDQVPELKKLVEAQKGRLIVSNIPVSSHDSRLRTDQTKGIWTELETFLKSLKLHPVLIPVADTLKPGVLITEPAHFFPFKFDAYFQPIRWRETIKALETERMGARYFLQVGGRRATVLEHQQQTGVLTADAHIAHINQIAHFDSANKIRGRAIIGEEFTVTEADINIEGQASGDFNLFHFNEDFSRRTRYGQKIAHGVLSAGAVLSQAGKIFPNWTVSEVDVPNFLWRVAIGDKITPVFKIVRTQAESRYEKDKIYLEFQAINQWGDIVLEGKATLNIGAEKMPSASLEGDALRQKAEKWVEGVTPLPATEPTNFRGGESERYTDTVTQDKVDGYSALYGNQNANLRSIVGLGILSNVSSRFGTSDAEKGFILSGLKHIDVPIVFPDLVNILRSHRDLESLAAAVRDSNVATADDLLKRIKPQAQERKRFRENFSSAMITLLSKMLESADDRERLAGAVRSGKIEKTSPLPLNDELIMKSTIKEVRGKRPEEPLEVKEGKRIIIRFEIETRDSKGTLVSLGEITKQLMKISGDRSEAEVAADSLKGAERLIERLISTTVQNVAPGDDRRMAEGGARDPAAKSQTHDIEDAVSPLNRRTAGRMIVDLFSQSRRDTPPDILNFFSVLRSYDSARFGGDRKDIERLLLNPDTQKFEDFVEDLPFRADDLRDEFKRALTPHRVILERFLHTAVSRKAAVRNLNSVDFQNKLQFVRPNNPRMIESAWDYLNVIANLPSDPDDPTRPTIDGVFIPKTKDPRELVLIDKGLTAIEIKRGWKVGSIKMEVLIEFPEAVENIDEIAQATPRLVALIYGHVDYTAATNSWDQNKQFEYQTYVKRRVVQAAKKYNLIAIDGISPIISPEAAEADAKLSAALGFHAKWSIHPKHGQGIARVKTFRRPNLVLREHGGWAQFKDEQQTPEEFLRSLEPYAEAGRPLVGVPQASEHLKPLIADEPMPERPDVKPALSVIQVSGDDLDALEKAAASAVHEIHVTVDLDSAKSEPLNKILRTASKNGKQIAVVLEAKNGIRAEGAGFLTRINLEKLFAKVETFDAVVLRGENVLREDVERLDQMLAELERQHFFPERVAIEIEVSSAKQIPELFRIGLATSRLTHVINKLPEPYDLLPFYQDSNRLGLSETEALKRAHLDQAGAILNAAAALKIQAVDRASENAGAVRDEAYHTAHMGLTGKLAGRLEDIPVINEMLTPNSELIAETVDIVTKYYFALYRDKKGAIPYPFRYGHKEIQNGLVDEATTKISRYLLKRIRDLGILETTHRGQRVDVESAYQSYVVRHNWRNGARIDFTEWEFIPEANFEQIRLTSNPEITATKNTASQFEMDNSVFTSIDERTKIATVRVIQPDTFPTNMIDTPTLEKLDRAFDDLAINENVRGIIFDADIGGGDIAQLISDGMTVEKASEYINFGKRVARKLSAGKKHVAVVVKDYAVGGGVTFALSGHALFASESAYFRMPEVPMKLNAGMFQMIMLPRVMGLQEALRVLLSGEKVSFEDIATEVSSDPHRSAVKWLLERIKEGEAPKPRDWGRMGEEQMIKAFKERIVDSVERETPAFTDRVNRLLADVENEIAKPHTLIAYRDTFYAKIADVAELSDLASEVRTFAGMNTVFTSDGTALRETEENRGLIQLVERLEEKGLGEVAQGIIRVVGLSYLKNLDEIIEIETANYVARATSEEARAAIRSKLQTAGFGAHALREVKRYGKDLMLRRSVHNIVPIRVEEVEKISGAPFATLRPLLEGTVASVSGPDGKLIDAAVLSEVVDGVVTRIREKDLTIGSANDFVFDLSDPIHPSLKPLARKVITQLIKTQTDHQEGRQEGRVKVPVFYKTRNVILRLNDVSDSGNYLRDLEVIKKAGGRIDTVFIQPRNRNEAETVQHDLKEIAMADSMGWEQIHLVSMISDLDALNHVEEIAVVDGTIGLVMGYSGIVADLVERGDIEYRFGENAWDIPALMPIRERLQAAAIKNGLMLIDSVTITQMDRLGKLLESAEKAREFGFTGARSLTPDQSEVLSAIFSDEKAFEGRRDEVVDTMVKRFADDRYRARMPVPLDKDLAFDVLGVFVEAQQKGRGGLLFKHGEINAWIDGYSARIFMQYLDRLHASGRLLEAEKGEFARFEREFGESWRTQRLLQVKSSRERPIKEPIPQPHGFGISAVEQAIGDWNENRELRAKFNQARDRLREGPGIEAFTEIDAFLDAAKSRLALRQEAKEAVALKTELISKLLLPRVLGLFNPKVLEHPAQLVSFKPEVQKLIVAHVSAEVLKTQQKFMKFYAKVAGFDLSYESLFRNNPNFKLVVYKGSVDTAELEALGAVRFAASVEDDELIQTYVSFTHDGTQLRKEIPDDLTKLPFLLHFMFQLGVLNGDVRQLGNPALFNMEGNAWENLAVHTGAVSRLEDELKAITNEWQLLIAA